MALLTPPDILPEAMRFLVRAILALPDSEVDRAELMALVAPPGLVEAMDSMGQDAEAMPGDESDLRAGGGVIATASLDALRMLGVVEQASDRVSLATGGRAMWRRPSDVDPQTFADHILDTIIRQAEPEASPGDSRGVMDLIHALVVLHVSREPLRPFERFEPARIGSAGGRSLMDEQQARFGDDRSTWPVPNKEQWLSLRRWGPYLGLARTVGSNGLIPDASRALTRRLSELPAGDYDIQDFVARCASAVPILDGGSLHFGHDSSASGEHAVLSPGLSLTLLQLEANERVTMPPELSDTSKRTLSLGSVMTADRDVSHIHWLPGKRTGRGSR